MGDLLGLITGVNEVWEERTPVGMVTGGIPVTYMANYYGVIGRE